MEDNPAQKLFDSLNNFEDLEKLIIQAESEGLFLECKAPADPTLTKELKYHLAKAVSGFANTEGGVMLYGMATTRHSHSGLDVLTQIEPIGYCNRFAQQIENVLPRLTTPALTNIKIKTITQSRTDKKGLVAVCIPKLKSDPVQSTVDNLFYYKTGDEFTPAPYEIIKRLFAASDCPDLGLVLHDDSISYERKNNTWNIPLTIVNKSIAAAENYHISVDILSKRSVKQVSIDHLIDASRFNPGQIIYMTDLSQPRSTIFRGVNFIIGTMKIQMGNRFRKFIFEIDLLAHMMIARKITCTLDLVEDKPKVIDIKEKTLY